MKKPSIFIIICLLVTACILFATRQRQPGLKQDKSPAAVLAPTNLAPTNSDIWDVGPVTEADYSSPDPIKYEEQIRQIKEVEPALFNRSSGFSRSFEQGHFLISTNRLADGSYRLVIVDKTAGTFCLRDQSGKNIWAKSIGMKDLSSREHITGMGTTTNMIGIIYNSSMNYYYDLESGQFIWMVGARHWKKME
jgi:hypothetical protein